MRMGRSKSSGVEVGNGDDHVGVHGTRDEGMGRGDEADGSMSEREKRSVSLEGISGTRSWLGRKKDLNGEKEVSIVG